MRRFTDKVAILNPLVPKHGFLSIFILAQETSTELGDLLSKLKLSYADLEPVQAAVVRDAHR